MCGPSKQEYLHNQLSGYGTKYGATAKEQSDLETQFQKQAANGQDQLTKAQGARDPYLGESPDGYRAEMQQKYEANLDSEYKSQLDTFRKNYKGAPDLTDEALKTSATLQRLRLLSGRGRASSFLTGPSQGALGNSTGM